MELDPKTAYKAYRKLSLDFGIDLPPWEEFDAAGRICWAEHLDDLVTKVRDDESETG